MIGPAWIFRKSDKMALNNFYIGGKKNLIFFENSPMHSGTPVLILYFRMMPILALGGCGKNITTLMVSSTGRCTTASASQRIDHNMHWRAAFSKAVKCIPGGKCRNITRMGSNCRHFFCSVETRVAIFKMYLENWRNPCGVQVLCKLERPFESLNFIPEGRYESITTKIIN